MKKSKNLGNPGRKTDNTCDGFLDSRKTNMVRVLAESLCEGEGFELVYLKYLQEGSEKILRFYINKPGGVTLDDCADVSRQLGDVLDVELGNCDSYRLEVSSPGSECSQN